MAVDFDWEAFFTPAFTGGFDNSQGWKRPWALAYLNINSFPTDTLPEIYQYIPGQRYVDGLRAPVQFMEITKTLDQGSWASIAMLTESDRDIFEISDNEGSGHQLPRMKFKFRTHSLNMQAKADGSMPSPALFVGNLTDVSIDMVGDLKQDNQQDGMFQIMLDFESPETFLLQNDVGAPLWYHRANLTTDQYHWNFTTNDNITFDAIITLIVAWMNQGKPTTDYPITYSYTPKGVAPYTTSIFDPIATAILKTDLTAATVTFTNGSATVTGVSTAFDTDLWAGMKIKLNADNVWVIISSIESATSLTLTANYSSTGGAGASSYNMNINTIVSCKDTPTWEILRKILTHMSTVEGTGNKYIPTCSTTGVIDVTLGGFNKSASVDQDFRDTWGAQDNTSFTIPGGDVTKFNLVYVPFTAINDNEYWFKFTLYEWVDAAWSAIYTYPNSGYEYIPYDANNTHGGRHVSVPTQLAGTYKWDAEIVTGGAFDVNTVGGQVYSPAKYNIVHDAENPTTKISYRRLKTFVATQGKCAEVNVLTATNLIGCPDGGATNNKCPDLMGCYPDPRATHTLTGTITTANNTTITGSGTAFTTELQPNWKIMRDAAGTYSTIKSIESDTSLTLTASYGSVGSGSATAKEGVNSDYGILGLTASYSGISSLNVWTTKCRQRSKDVYECHQNTGSKIREPLDVNLVFNNGWTPNLIGLYLNIYSPELNEMVMVRCTEQRHVLRGKQVKTFVRAFRV